MKFSLSLFLTFLVMCWLKPGYSQTFRVPPHHKPVPGKLPETTKKPGKKSYSTSGYKNVTGILTCHSTYYPDTVIQLDFSLTLSGSDTEHGDSLAVIFPSGFTPLFTNADSLTPVTQGQEPERFNGISDSTITWGDNDNSSGGIEPGTTYYFSVIVNIGAVAGPQNIFYYISGDGNSANPSDFSGITVLNEHTPGANPDLAVFALPFSRYFAVPLHHADTLVFSSLVTNSGAALSVPKDMVFQDTLQNFVSRVALEVPLFAGDTDTVYSAPFYPSVTGVHLVTTFAENYTDEAIDDNIAASLLVVTDSLFARTTTDTAFTAPLNSQGFQASFGSWHELKEPDTLTSVLFFLEDPVPGATFSVSVHPFGNSPGAAIAVTPADTAKNGPGWYIADVEPDVVLPAGRFFVAVNQTDTNSIGLAFSPYNFLPGASYFNAGTGWQTIESVDPAFTILYLLMPSFGLSSYTEPTAADLTVDLLYPAGLYSTPLSQNTSFFPEARVGNQGADLSPSVTLDFTLNPGNCTSSAVVPDGFPQGADTLMTGNTACLPPTAGVYTFTALTVLATDPDPSNNEDTVRFTITDTLMSRSDMNPFMAIPFGPNTDLSGGQLPPVNAGAGTFHFFTSADSLTSVKVLLNGTRAGDRFFATMHPALDGRPVLDSLLGTTDTVTTFAGQSEVSMVPQGGRLILKDSVFIYIHALTADNQPSEIAVTRDVYSPGADLIHYPAGVPQFEFIDFETIGVQGTFAIQLGLGSYSGVGISTEKPGEKVVLYPNPATGSFRVKNAAGCMGTLYSADGRAIRSGISFEDEHQIDLADCNPGLYFLVLTKDGNTRSFGISITR